MREICLEGGFAGTAVGDWEVVAEEDAVAVVVDGASERVNGVVAKHLRARIVVDVDWAPASHNGLVKGRSRVVGRNIVTVVVEMARCEVPAWECRATLGFFSRS